MQTVQDNYRDVVEIDRCGNDVTVRFVEVDDLAETDLSFLMVFNPERLRAFRKALNAAAL